MLNRDAPPSVSHCKCLHAFTASTFNNMETITVSYINTCDVLILLTMRLNSFCVVLLLIRSIFFSKDFCTTFYKLWTFSALNAQSKQLNATQEFCAQVIGYRGSLGYTPSIFFLTVELAQLCGFQRARTLAHHFTLTFSVPNVSTISLEAVIVLRCCFFCFGPYYIFVSTVFFLILTVRVPFSVSAVL